MKRSLRHVILSTALVGAASTAVAAPSSIEQAGAVTSVDDVLGVPTIMWASPSQQPIPPTHVRDTHEQVARWYLEQYAPLYKLSPAALRAATASHVHDTGRGGIIVRFEQKVDGVPVARTRLNVLMKRHTYQLVALTGNLHYAAGAKGAKVARTFSVTEQEALAAAFADVWQLPTSASSIHSTGYTKAGYRYYDMTPAGQIADARLAMIEPARVTKVYFPVGVDLVPAYYLELTSGHTTTRDASMHGYHIAADDGRVLEGRSLVDEDAYTYTVWADQGSLFTPLDGPFADFTPHPTGTPDTIEPTFIAPVQVTMEGFNTNPSGLADPWLPAGAIETVGNNIDAYTDHLAPDGFDVGVDIRADVTSANTFDHVYDTALDPLISQTQMKGSVVQLFYVTNWLHDYFYDSGFNEASGNAQADNFGRGGVDGDSLRAEAQDGALAGSRNNANMSTPADGARPRMQMFLWSGRQLANEVNALNQTFEAGGAAFGPQNFSVTAELALADDGTGAANDGCEPLVNIAEVTGRIALVDRGTCGFAIKVANAQAAGALGALVANNAAGAGVINMGGTDPTITIPSQMVSFEDGAALKTALQSGPVTVTLARLVEPERDGTIDNQIIAHEWGHYIHRRLVVCTTNQCGAMSEGWGDFIALFMTIREGDDVNNGAFGVGIYGPISLQDSGYFGIRRLTYSVNPDFNALSFRHIADGEPLPTNNPISPVFSGNPNSSVHNAGEIWANMMFEAYVSLINETTGPTPRYTFADAQRRMADYVVAGLKLTPPGATYTEARDGIIAAAAAADVLDAELIGDAFIRRGAGTCAVAPPRGSTNFVGTVESFVKAPNMALKNVTINDDVRSCDTDGFLDADEKGALAIEIQNTGPAPLENTKLIVSSPTPGIRFPNGPNATLPTLAPFETGVGNIVVELGEEVVENTQYQLDITVLNGDTCVLTASTFLVADGNLDVSLAATADDAESPLVVWTETSDIGSSGIWSRIQDPGNETNHVFHGIDFAAPSDTSFESPRLEVDPAANFVVTLGHRYNFEPTFDGGVIELSRDGGVIWEDVTTFGVDPGYDGPLPDFNAIGARDAFTGTNASFPNADTLTLDFGTQFAGETVLLRFRIGSDPSVGAPGWDVDEIQFSGITNTPFPVLQDDAADCFGVPTAVAGDDLTVMAGDLVTLDASESSDPENDPLTFAWELVGAAGVTLEGADQPVVTFVAPNVATNTELMVQVTVADEDASAMDQVIVTVLAGPAPDGGPITPPGDGYEPGGCGCQTGGNGPAGNASMLLLIGAVIAILRRRRSR